VCQHIVATWLAGVAVMPDVNAFSGWQVIVWSVCGVSRQQHQGCLQEMAVQWRSSWLRRNGELRDCGRTFGSRQQQISAFSSI
jgi:hypothetical protein